MNGRDYDLELLYRELYHAPDSLARRNIQKSIALIKQETGLIGSMREALVKAHRNRDYEEVKDIHDFIQYKSRYKRINDI